MPPKIQLKFRLILPIAIALTTGCFTTQVKTGRTSDGIKHQDRQWFLANGLFGLSDPAGSECTQGLAQSQSSLRAMDFAVSLGLALAGSVVGSLACSDESNLCATAGANVAGWLFGTRTVEYECASSVALVPSDDDAVARVVQAQAAHFPRNQASTSAAISDSP